MAFFIIWYFFIHLCLLTVFFPLPFNWKYIPMWSGTLSYLLLYFWYTRGIEEILVSGVNKLASWFSWHKPYFSPLERRRPYPISLCLLTRSCSLAFTDFDISTIPASDILCQHCANNSLLPAARRFFNFQLPCFTLARFFLCHFHVCWGWVGLPSVYLSCHSFVASHVGKAYSVRLPPPEVLIEK